MRMRRTWAFGIVLAAALPAIGCGWGDGNDNDPPTGPEVTNHTQVFDPGTMTWDFEFFWNDSFDPEGDTPLEYYGELYQAGGSSPSFPFDFSSATLYASSGWITGAPGASAASASTTGGSGSQSTRTRAHPSSASARDSATTATTGSPCHTALSTASGYCGADFMPA